ncbi:hypothetical protein WH87_11835 [Devosia epidermidihirudinis]|uniref:ABM domain-containing protein n=1 Tax=Devosia epidermidihirudinis TaxID=1293439 RepID=A0A0F5QB76_9HYPH|nr:putative quinol monooxygenase [Devosia epidermidihirudinis]KKC37249.1 hypothetical protein WH87_11835 [Devosia epidermidihirudinis]
MIYVVATFHLHPGKLEPFVVAAHAAIDASRRETGCFLYDLHASVTDPDRVVMLEQWETREALDRHLSSNHIANFTHTNKPYVVSVKVEVIHPQRIEVL